MELHSRTRVRRLISLFWKLRERERKVGQEQTRIITSHDGTRITKRKEKGQEGGGKLIAYAIISKNVKAEHWAERETRGISLEKQGWTGWRREAEEGG